ncbi:MAG TPA: DUF4838 domain-containing protein, partial [Clostridia bacterium]|nr:DUF4838 domain-containing protein [Clostridia bacterium]
PDNTPAHSREIMLGENARLVKGGMRIPWERLGTDGYVIQESGRRLYIAGGKPRGTLNGVYALLEEKLGVRWFTPELEMVPRTNRLVLPALRETFVPVLEYREVFWTEMMREPDFAARHRLNGHHYKLGEKHGGRFAVYQPFVHSFDALVPQELFKDHPDYFPFINGKRVGGYVQRCLANPEVVKLAIAKVRQWIKENPQATIISVSQNDTANYCQCEACKQLDEAEGTPCASLLRFVNRIAQDIETDHPQVRIDTLAYQYTRKPPKTLRPRQNVIIRLCSIECCFAHPLVSCRSEANRRFREDILSWQPVAPLLYIWDYTPNFANYQQPFPNFLALQPNVQFFTQHGVKGLFEQGNYSTGGLGEMGPLRSYLLAKLLWNPNTDLQQHTREFVTAWFGPAAPQIERYLEMLRIQNPEVHAHIYDSPKAPYLTDDFVQHADALLKQAEEAAEDPTVRFRVQVARLPVWYVQLVTSRVQGQERERLLQRFIEISRQAGITHISESQSFEDWAKQMQK